MRPLKSVELAELPAVVDITTAARALGLSRTYAYQLAKQDQFPCKILRIGTCCRVPQPPFKRCSAPTDRRAPLRPERLGEARKSVERWGCRADQL
ncbi:hypothetical protein GCM10010177_81050 [Actinomadura citrea]|nr:hypothetical protein GCM10010177_81050 [Actinomadura citrea]